MNQEKVGKFIAECRRQKKMTQADFGERLGVTEKSVSNWENGRNMPDLSLFSMICHELDITVNELMSGEKVSKEDYQDKLEENIINLSISADKKTRKRIKKSLIVTFFTLSILLIGRILYHSIELNVYYEKTLMTCDFKDNVLIYRQKGSTVLNTYHMERVVDGTKYIIFHDTINLYNKNYMAWEYRENFANSLSGEFENHFYGIDSSLEQDIEHYDNIVVFYTEESMSKLKRMTDEKFLKNLKKLNKMCSLY